MKTAAQLEVDNVHLLHEIETMRGKMLRMIDEHAYMLTTAYQALSRGKTDVAAERLGYVLDDLAAKRSALTVPRG